MPKLTCLIVIAILMTVGIPAQCDDSVPTESTRWAVLAPVPHGDFLTVELSKRNDIELVERAEIDKALTELELSAATANETVAHRLALCSLLHADRLLTVSEPQIDKDDPQSTILSIRVFDSQFGAMLTSAETVLPKEAPDVVARSVVPFVDDVQTRFAQGIDVVVGVSYFVSRNFDRSFDHLQEDYANVVSRSLFLQPGVAVVALEELSAIQRELAISGDKEKLFGRTIPVFVEGEYTIHLPEQAEPGELNAFSSANHISLKVVLKSPQRPDETIEKTQMELKEATEFLSVTLPNAILKRIGGSVSFSVAKQIEEFKQQADRSAAVGAIELALRYREAVFMLDPDDMDNALRLVVPFGAGRGPITDRYRAMPYIEHILSSKKLSLLQGLQLARATTVTTRVPFERDTKTLDRIYENDPLDIGPDYLFFRRLVPYLFELTPAPEIQEVRFHLNEHIRNMCPEYSQYLVIGNPELRQKAYFFDDIDELAHPMTYFPQAKGKEYTQEEYNRIRSTEGYADQYDEWRFHCHMKIRAKMVRFALDRSVGQRYIELLRESGDRDYMLYADVLEIRRILPNLSVRIANHPLTEQQYRDILAKIQALLKEHDPEGSIANTRRRFQDDTDAFPNLLRDLKGFERQLVNLFIPSVSQGIPIEITLDGPRLRGNDIPAARTDPKYSRRMEELGTSISLWLHPRPPGTISYNRVQRYGGNAFEGTVFREVGKIVLQDGAPIFFPVELYHNDAARATIRETHYTFYSQTHPLLLEQFDAQTDIFWNSFRLFKIFKDASGTILSKQINIDMSEFGDRHKIMLRVRGDGHNLWIATVNGIDVFSIDGKRLARFDKDILPTFETNTNGMIQVSYPPGEELQKRDQHDEDSSHWLEDNRDMTEQFRMDIRYTLTVFPTAPGEALAIGKGGPLGQTWIGKLTFDEKSGAKSFKLLLGTTRHLPTDDYLKPEVLAAPEQKDVIFSFPWTCPFPDSKYPNRRQVLVGRAHGDAYQFGNVPLLIDLDSDEVMVVTERYPDLHNFQRGLAVRCVNDCFVVLDGWKRLSVYYRGDDGKYQRQEVMPDSPKDYYLYVDGNSVYSPPGRHYASGGNQYDDLPTIEIDLSEQKPSIKTVNARKPPQHIHHYYTSSAVFGNVLLSKEFAGQFGGRHALHKIETGTIDIPEPPFKGIVPENLLEKHDAAVKKILSLGGKLLWQDDNMIVHLPTGQRVPGMCVAFDTDWKGSDADLVLLKDIYRIGRVYFHCATIGDEGFSHLYDISTISELYVMDTPISEAAIRKFPLRQLTDLHLEDVSTPPRYSDRIIIESFSNTSNLANLFLAGKGFTDQSRDHVQNMQRRPQLQVFNTSMSPNATTP